MIVYSKENSFIARIPSLVITKEHGSWAVLFVPMLVNACVAGRGAFIDFILVALAALGAFLSYAPAQVILRHYSGVPQRIEKLRQAKFWTTIYLCLTIGSVVPLLLKGFVLLLLVGVVGAAFFFCNFFFVKRFSKMIATDLIAIAGLTLSGPSVYYVLTGTLDKIAVMLYVLNCLFFGCSVFYVHMKISAFAAKKSEMAWREKLSLGNANLFYHVAVVAIVALLATLHCAPTFTIVAFLPMIVLGVHGTAKLSSRVQFKKLGFLLLGQSVLFGTLLCCVSWK